jgi:hypothetical protein
MIEIKDREITRDGAVIASLSYEGIVLHSVALTAQTRDEIKSVLHAASRPFAGFAWAEPEAVPPGVSVGSPIVSVAAPATTAAVIVASAVPTPIVHPVEPSQDPKRGNKDPKWLAWKAQH